VVFFFLAHLMLRRLVRLVAGGSAAAALEVENAVLRHQLVVLRRTVKRPELRRRDRVVWAAASGLLPRERWPVSVVSPQTRADSLGCKPARRADGVGVAFSCAPAYDVDVPNSGSIAIANRGNGTPSAWRAKLLGALLNRTPARTGLLSGRLRAAPTA
jgi:hypothetical protein